MTRVVVTAGCVGLLWVSGVGTASAAPAGTGHNCAGVVVSQAAGPGFGSTVSGAADQQLVDNLGLANCGQANRNNP